MSKHNRIIHQNKSAVYVRPQITHDSWLKLSSYAKTHEIDFPTAVDIATNLLMSSNWDEVSNLLLSSGGDNHANISKS